MPYGFLVFAFICALLFFSVRYLCAAFANCDDWGGEATNKKQDSVDESGNKVYYVPIVRKPKGNIDVYKNQS